MRDDKFRVVSPVGSVQGYELSGYVASYAELLMNVVTATDDENWSYFSDVKKDLALDFLQNGNLSRVIVRDRTIGQGRFEDVQTEPVAYVQCRLLKPNASHLLVNDIYSKLGLHGSDLWLQDIKNVSNDTPFYIDVVAVKKEYQNNRKILQKVIRAIDDIVSCLPEKPTKAYAVGVTELGRKMCEMFSGSSSKYYSSRVSTAERTLENKHGELETHTRALYEFKMDSFLDKLATLYPKAKNASVIVSDNIANLKSENEFLRKALVEISISKSENAVLSERGVICNQPIYEVEVAREALAKIKNSGEVKYSE